VARDRRRAKQRRARSGATAGQRAAGAAPETGGLERVDVPAALDHASADADEFDAALVRGAGGVAAEPEESSEELAGGVDAEREDEADAGAEDLLQDAPPRRGDGGRGGTGGAGGGGGGGGGGEMERPSGAPLREGNRALGFIRASWAELQRVAWPDRRQVAQATAVVLGFVAIAGAYLGLADFVAKEIVEFIL
jgi:preprotein translocase subunit SecE